MCGIYFREGRILYSKGDHSAFFFLALPLTDTKCWVATYLSTPGAWENMKGGVEIAYSGQSVLVELN